MPAERTSLSGSWDLARGPLRTQAQSPQLDEAALEPIGLVEVPGNLQLQIGIDDLWRDTPEVASLNHYEWIYRRTFESPSSPGRYLLVFDGIDYFCDVWVNGRHAGYHEGAFSTWELDVTELLSEPGAINDVALAISCPWRVDDRAYFLQPSTVFSVILKNSEYMKGNLLHYWDGLPLSGNAVFPFGPWRDIHLERRGGATLLDLAATTVGIGAGRAEIDLHCAWWSDEATAVDVALRIRIVPETFSGAVTELEAHASVPAGASEHTLRIEIDDPQLWWTWDMGPQNLYRVHVNEQSTVLGIRELHRDPDTLQYFLNGQRMFLRGVWYPFANIFSSVPQAAEHWRDVEMLRDANCNHFVSFTFIEKDPLYDAADRIGLLVFQELPYHQLGPMRVVEPGYPRLAEYWEWSLGEVENIVRQLRGHACVAVWAAFAETRKNERWVWGDYTEYAAAIEEIVARLDPDAIFHASFCDFKEEHIWNGGFPFGEFWDHAERNHNFISEFGAIAPPNVETLRELLPPGVIWDNERSRSGRVSLPIDVEEYSYLWSFDYAGLCTSVARMFEHVDDEVPTLERFVDAIQWYQALGLRYCAETYRRKRFADIAGCRTWSYRENLPGIKFTVVDHRQRPKMGYFALQQAYSPLLLSVDERLPLAPLAAGTRWERDVWIVNDRPEAHADVVLDVRLLDPAGACLQEVERATGVAGDDARVERIALDLPGDPGPYLLRLELSDASGATLAASEGWLRVVAPAFAEPVRVLLVGQHRYNAPIEEALSHVGGVALTVIDETTRDPQVHTWSEGLRERTDVVWFAGWDYAAHQFTTSEWTNLRDAVAAGVGLVHTGGQGSFHGGDGRGALLDITPLGEALPVKLRPHDGVWDHEPVVSMRPVDEPLGISLEGLPHLGFSRTTARDGATVHWTADEHPLLVTGSHGAGRTVALMASLTKPLRMFRIGEGLDWEDPLDVQPHWARDDIKAYSPYWRENLQLHLGLIAYAAGRAPTSDPQTLATRQRLSIFQVLAELAPAELDADISELEWYEERGETRGVIMVRNVGAVCARLVRATVQSDFTRDHRFRDGFVDLLPGESMPLRFEASCRPSEVGGVVVAAQNAAATTFRATG